MTQGSMLKMGSLQKYSSCSKEGHSVSFFVVTCVWSCSESRLLGLGHGHAGSQRITGPLYLLVVADVVMQLCSA